jgi:hypothetical protein
VADCCEYGDEHSGSGATELVNMWSDTESQSYHYAFISRTERTVMSRVLHNTWLNIPVVTRLSNYGYVGVGTSRSYRNGE